MMPFEKLSAWAACHDLLLAIYRTSQTWPVQERYGLTAQIRRAALSAGSNIAEGVIKRSPAEFARFLDMSLGSLSELSYQLRAARDLGILREEDYTVLAEKQQEAGRLTWGLYAAIRKRAAQRGP
jgi:four helix bundle protein